MRTTACVKLFSHIFFSYVHISGLHFSSTLLCFILFFWRQTKSNINSNYSSWQQENNSKSSFFFASINYLCAWYCEVDHNSAINSVIFSSFTSSSSWKLCTACSYIHVLVCARRQSFVLIESNQSMLFSIFPFAPLFSLFIPSIPTRFPISDWSSFVHVAHTQTHTLCIVYFSCFQLSNFRLNRLTHCLL